MRMLHAILALFFATTFCKCHGAKTSPSRGLAAAVRKNDGKQGKRGKRTMKTPAPTVTPAPTYSPTVTAIPTLSPTMSPTLTPLPSLSPTVPPTAKPTAKPTPRPTKKPTHQPTKRPTRTPTFNPTFAPTASMIPTLSPTTAPSFPPPTPRPTRKPTRQPTRKPTKPPTASPTFSPTVTPIPTFAPTTTAFPTFAPTGFPTRQKKGKTNKKGLKGRIFQTRAAPTSQSPSLFGTSQPTFTTTGTFGPTLTPTTLFLPTISPSAAVVHAKKGMKGKRPNGSGSKGLKQQERSLRKGKGASTVSRRKKNTKGAQVPQGKQARAVLPPSSAPVTVVSKATGKGSAAKQRRKKNAPISQANTPKGKQTRIKNPSSAPVGVVSKATALPKGSGKFGGPKGSSKGKSSSPVGTTSTIEFRSPDKEGPPQVIPYEPLGKNGGPKTTSSMSSGSPTATPSALPRQSTAGSKVPTAGAPKTGLKSQIFSTVDLPKFSLKFTVGKTSTKPTEQNNKDLSVITAVMIDSIFFEYFQGKTNTQYYSTNIASFTPTTPFDVEFTTSCNFLLPSATPNPGQLASILSEKFNELSFVALLKRLAATDVFSSTTHVAIEIDPSVLEPITPASNPSVAPTSSSTKINAKVIAPVAAAAGALVAILAAAVFCYRSRRRSVASEETIDKKLPSDAPEDATVEGSCYNSVVSRSMRNSGKNGTAEFGDTAGDYDDCATQASGSYSMTPLPTIGESDDEVASDSYQQQGDRSREASSPCTTDEMSLSEVPLFEESD